MENEDYIIIDGIQNIEKLNEQNEIQKNKIDTLEKEKNILQNKYKSSQKNLEELTIKFSELKLKYSQNRLLEKEDNSIKKCYKRAFSFNKDYDKTIKRIKYE